VVGVDDAWCRAIAMRRLTTEKPTFGVHIEHDATRPAGAVTLADLQPFEAADCLVRFTQDDAVRLTTPALRGPHNLQNIGCTTWACMSLYGSNESMVRTLHDGLKSFPGLAHRMELLGSLGSVAYVNDSKATNADSTAKALNSFGAGLHWIVGGQAKDGGIESLAPFFGNVSKAYLIGAASDTFAATLATHHVVFERCETLANAVAAAAEKAGKGTVLLSPACASFDQFKDFEDRGHQFRKLVEALPGFVPYGAKGGA
jgi:UDP-N-acetylmuramoylalanine--D-glutamate ligase